MVIPTLLWILPNHCSEVSSQGPCSFDSVSKLYSSLRLGLIQLFYVSLLCLSSSFIWFCYMSCKQHGSEPFAISTFRILFIVDMIRQHYDHFLLHRHSHASIINGFLNYRRRVNKFTYVHVWICMCVLVHKYILVDIY